MISVYQGPEDRGDWGDRETGRPDVLDYPDIPEHPGHPGLPGLPGLPDHPEYPEPLGHIHRYWMAGSERLDDGLMNTAWQANR